jgi:outer membrane protein assembly factor BamB
MLSRPLCLPGLLAGTLVIAACSGNGAGPGGADTGAGLDGGHKSDATERDGGKDGSMQGHDGAVDAGPTGPAVLQHHADGTRAGLYVDPAFTKAAIPGLEPLPSFNFIYPDLGVIGPEAVFSQVLFESRAVKGQDALFVTTERDNVYALNPDTGAVLWKTSVGTPGTAALFPTGCGSIYPLGITSTPVIDAASGTLYLVAMTTVGGKADYVVNALSVADGSSRWTLDLNATILGFDSSVQMQRGALTITNGVLYFPFGALAGACGEPYAWVVGVPLASPKSATAWRPKVIGAGIWGPSGVATDGTSIYVGTSENTAPSEPPVWAMGNSEALLRITAGPAFSGKTTDFFAPPDWFAQDEGGGQIGSSGVVLLDQPGSTPSALAFVIGKTANASLLDRTNLGGIGGQLAFLPSAAGDWVEGAMSAYTTSAATYVAMGAPGGTCPVGSDLSTVKVVAGSPPTLAPGWCASQGGHGSPVTTASSVASGVGSDVVVWGLGTSHQGTAGNGKLTAFDGDTGAMLAQSTTTMSDLEHWNSPIVVNGRLYFAGDKRVYAFDLKGTKQSLDAGVLTANPDAGVPSSCLITVSGVQVDRCVPYGLTCQGNPQNGELGTCLPPTEGELCQTTSGCATGLSCEATATSDAGVQVHRCVAPCNATTPCSNLFEACHATGADAGTCDFVPCGAGTDAGSLYGACSNSASAGTCLPLYNDDGTQSGGCFQSGTLDGGTCASARSSGVSSYCQPGEFCAKVNGTACMALCNFAASAGYVDGGPSCPSGTTCVALFGSSSSAGLCAKPCGGDAGACPTSFTCEEWDPANGASACFP